MNTNSLRIKVPLYAPHSSSASVAEQPHAHRASSAPLVSFGLNCYKAERWIGECLDSLLAQTLQDFEVVISDNASPDGTYEICQAYAARDPRIRVYRTDRNIGVAGNLNRVFELARGEFFCWVSANDYYDPRFLERCVHRLRENPTMDLVAPQRATFQYDTRDAELDPKQVNASMSGGADRVVALLKSNRDGRLFRGLYRSGALRPLVPLSSRFGQDVVLVASIAARGKVEMLDGEPLYYERNAPGAATHTIPAHLRVGHYEPEHGLRAYVFHRCRNQVEFWRIALSSVATPGDKLQAIRGMLAVSYQWKSDIYYDLYDIAGLIRGYVRTWRKRN
jgi:glycosyltransferase involved in cell wall biosynthesis